MPNVGRARRCCPSPWIGCVTLVLLSAVAAADERLPIKAYTSADGLASDDVTRIVRDSRGFLWFCTAEGLSRFDGYSFVNFGTDEGLPHGRVNDLLETRDGEYFVATDGGLVRFDPRGRAAASAVDAGSPPERRMFTVVPPDNDAPADWAVTVLVESSDRAIWIGSENGLFRLRRNASALSLESIGIGLPHHGREARVVSDVLEEASGALWIATPAGLYRRERDGASSRFTVGDGLPSDHLADLYEDRNGRLWAASRLNGFFRFRFDAAASRIVVDLAYRKEAAPSSWVFRMFEGSDGRFWLGTARGLLEYFPSAPAPSRAFRSYSIRNGLTHNDIPDVVEDAAGNLWLATPRAGVMKVARNGFTSYGERDGLGQIGAIFSDLAGNLCFRAQTIGPLKAGPSEAVYEMKFGCFDGSGFRWFHPASVHDHGWVSERVTVRTADGEWWVGTGEGLYRFPPPASFHDLETARPRHVYTKADGLTALQVYRLFADSRGDVWISTIGEPNGLARWERRTAQIRNLAGSPGLPAFDRELARAFAEDTAGRVWVGFDSGIARSGPRGFDYFTTRDGVPPGFIRDILVDRADRVWLASSRSGVVRVDQASSARPRFVALTTADGLSSNNTEVLLEDPEGYIYIGGGRGLDRLEPSTGRLRSFTTADGLAGGVFRAAFRDRHGVLWFGTSGGLARFAPRPETDRPPPVVHIRGVRVSGRPQPVSALGETEMSLPAFGARDNPFEIDFSGVNFGNGDVLRYQFRLDGADVDWSAPTERRTVTYANLRPGRYRLLVRAVTSDGATSANPASLGFTILRPFWQRWWFLLPVGLAVAWLAQAGYRYRVARLLEMANMRTRIATDLHDDIGANLTRIVLLSEVAARQDVDGAHLQSIARIARESVSSMSDIVWAIKPARETVLDLTRRMRQHADEIFTLREVRLFFNAPTPGDAVKLGVDVRRDLLLVFKEAVSNCARHSGCSEVRIDFRMERGHLTLSIADNGVGFDPEMAREGQGLTSMARRAMRLTGQLRIVAEPGRGTTVRLDLPLRAATRVAGTT